MYSLVTACMNRDQHLRQSLPSWLALPDVAEILILDWCNATPLIDLCRLDQRIRVVRVEGEPRWILSYAYNLGVARATHPEILKCDADCIPTAGALLLHPGATHFYAGYWKSGHAAHKPSVNGQCIFSKEQFARVGGYNEYIRTYGRDDEDFYDRLIASGLERREITPELLNFIDHDEEARTSNQFDRLKEPSIEEVLKRNTTYNEIHNYYIGKSLPWDGASPMAQFKTVEVGERFERVERDRAAEQTIPQNILQGARLFALRRTAQTLVKLSNEAADRLDEKSCLALLRNRIKIPSRA